ncbi:hypothetical protein BT96DRAFT_820461 [Gymnopus androsaceus JB14]|uniref:DUF202 domain-containing protein n=1 Tax=Gymnopus androsaceus JB14 TaxID=1447944 RepID=A0A6A4HPG7_9AGAR|nr:hypothetical protein BT96DRAFT_820461 [Gymnopus androsaceus JB14]
MVERNHDAWRPCSLLTANFENTGSTARDFCFLERNLLAHIKLALLFSVLSSSLILHTRLVPDSGDSTKTSSINLPLAGLQFAASLLAIFGGVWEYLSGFQDLMNIHAFLTGTKYVQCTMYANSYLIYC